MSVRIVRKSLVVPRKARTAEAVVAREVGARGVVTEAAHEVEAELFERAAQLWLLAGFEFHVSELGATRHEPGGSVRSMRREGPGR